MELGIQEKKYLDIVETLSSGRERLLLDTTMQSKLLRKLLIIQELLKGKAGFLEVLGNILPDRFGLALGLGDQVRDLDAEILFQRLFGDRFVNDPLQLLNFRLHYLPRGNLTLRERYLYLFAAIAQIREIVLADQYLAQQFLQENSVVIDAGANIGLFSLWASSLSPQGKVYAFEPSTLTFSLLRKNVLANNLPDRIYPYREGLGERPSSKKLLISGGVLQTDNAMADSSFVEGREGGFVGAEEVEITTIDNLVEQAGLERVNFIKIDTEGYEGRVIQGASKTIKTFSPTIACSAYHLASDKTELPKLVLSINPSYRYRIDKKNEEDLIFWVDKRS